VTIAELIAQLPAEKRERAAAALAAAGDDLAALASVNNRVNATLALLDSSEKGAT
jgi:hypothetical protein